MNFFWLSQRSLLLHEDKNVPLEGAGGQVLMEKGFRYENDCLSKKEETTCIGSENFVVKLEKILDRMLRPKKTGRKHKKLIKSSRDRKK